MFRPVLDHPQGDIFFTSVTKDKRIGFVVACLLFLLCFVLMLLCARPSLVVAVLYSTYNRHATTNQIILSLVTEVKKKNISLRMVKD